MLENIKKEPVVYLSEDIRDDTFVKNFKINTVFLQAEDFKKVAWQNFGSAETDKLEIAGFSPLKIEINTSTTFPQMLVYQQNYYKGWNVYVDGIEKDLFKSNFAHISVLVPAGEHTVVFEYKNTAIIYSFCFTALIFLILIALFIKYYNNQHPEWEKQVILVLVSLISIFVLVSSINRFLYNKNKMGLTPVIVEKVDQWRTNYRNDIRILLSTKQMELRKSVNSDENCFINEKNNVSELSNFLMNSGSKYFGFAWQGGIISDELFELIYSFYPVIIEHEKRNNSGYILLEKDSGDQTYDFIRTFEPDTPDWIQNSARTKVDSISGNHTYFYNENEEFGTSIEFSVGKDLMTKDKITILTDFIIEEKLAEALLVFTTMRDGELKIYQTMNIRQFAKYPDKWSRAAFDFKITPEIGENDIIKIYFWNIKKVKFQIDNLKIKYSNTH